MRNNFLHWLTILGLICLVYLMGIGRPNYYEIQKIVSFIDSSNILSSIVVTLVVTSFLYFIFRTPRFEMRILVRPLHDKKETRIELDLKNTNQFVSFSPKEIYLTFFLPEDFFTSKPELFQNKIDAGWTKIKNLSDEYININGTKYMGNCIAVDNNVFPNRFVATIKAEGIFDVEKISKYPIYFLCSTKFGTYPKNRSDEMISRGEGAIGAWMIDRRPAPSSFDWKKAD